MKVFNAISLPFYLYRIKRKADPEKSEEVLGCTFSIFVGLRNS
ncbi:hypothetical protein P872_20525 [Rhodonellum psychrophilum GCM71 = DSM 17998]|uniref:Uncharacterized protein n=1 Tax=Rhodonellum psychrophilum GCM71 = DSM 17998 TaxID=1123057 RepID=U5BX18_9BACT|nr:hypothetical protein P872_20525 [Rhodonellum psychrophilum GCM71 = DSM 17998]